MGDDREVIDAQQVCLGIKMNIGVRFGRELRQRPDSHEALDVRYGKPYVLGAPRLSKWNVYIPFDRDGDPRRLDDLQIVQLQKILIRIKSNTGVTFRQPRKFSEGVSFPGRVLSGAAPGLPVPPGRPTRRGT